MSEVPTFEEFLIAREKKRKSVDDKRYKLRHRERIAAREAEYRQRPEVLLRRNQWKVDNRDKDATYKARKRAKYRTGQKIPVKPDSCEVCGSIPIGKHTLHFDHCHIEGHFRGWICRDCNLALGYVKDDIKRLKALIRYLKERG